MNITNSSYIDLTVLLIVHMVILTYQYIKITTIKKIIAGFYQFHRITFYRSE